MANKTKQSDNIQFESFPIVMERDEKVIKLNGPVYILHLPFSQIHHTYVEFQNGIPTAVTRGEISAEEKKDILSVMFNFSRFDATFTSGNITTSEKISFINEALWMLNDYCCYKDLSVFERHSPTGKTAEFASIYTPCLFDLMEIQSEILPKRLRSRYHTAINKVFKKHNLPWELSNCHINLLD